MTCYLPPLPIYKVEPSFIGHCTCNLYFKDCGFIVLRVRNHFIYYPRTRDPTRIQYRLNLCEKCFCANLNSLFLIAFLGNSDLSHDDPALTDVFLIVRYSDFHNLMRFTSKKMPTNILKNVCKKVFLLVKPFLANLHSSSSKILIHVLNDPKFFYFFYAEFYADFKSAEIIGKKCTQKKLFAKNFCKLLAKKRTTIFLLFCF